MHTYRASGMFFVSFSKYLHLSGSEYELLDVDLPSHAIIVLVQLNLTIQNSNYQGLLCSQKDSVIDISITISQHI